MRSYVRIPTRDKTPFQARNANISARIKGEERAVSGSAPTLTGDLTETPDMEVTAMQDSTQVERRRIAGEYLTRARDDLEQATRTRLHYISLARQYGLTLTEIGALLGISESSVRYIVKTHGGD